MTKSTSIKYQLTALLLLLVFLCPQVVQVIHHHSQTETFAVASQDKIPDAAVQKLLSTCSICDYFIAKPSNQYNCPNVLSLDNIYNAEEIITALPCSHDHVIAFTHSWITRGPPIS